MVSDTAAGDNGRTCIFHVGVEAEQDLMLENPETGERELRPVCGDCWYHAFGHKGGSDGR